MINLSNYEEYFLLYADGELSNEQCKTVEAFIQQHTHLTAELNMLQQAKLQPDESVLFGDKEALFKTAANSISLTNYEKYFLLYTDNELTEAAKEETGRFVLQHPQLQEAFILLQQTKLQPEIIECPNKHRLYKQPGKRIVPLYFTRIAAAAVIAGIIVLTGSLFIKNNHQPPVAFVKQDNKTIQQNKQPSKKPGIILPEKKNNKENIVAENGTAPAKKTSATTSNIINKTTDEKDTGKSGDKIMIAQIALLPLVQPTAPLLPADTKNVSLKTQQPVVLKLLKEDNEDEEKSTVLYVSNDYSSIQPAVYKELNTADEEQTLYVGSLQLNKAKVNGLFKKASRLLGSKVKEQNIQQ